MSCEKERGSDASHDMDEDMTLREAGLSQKTTCWVTPFRECPEQANLRAEKAGQWLSGTEAGVGDRNKEALLNGHVSLGETKMF